MDLKAFPVLGICGWSNCGKTTLLEQLLGWFRQQSLSVIVVKRDVHGINLDMEGKDTDRFYRAGADVLIQGPEQTFIRSHHHDQAELVAAVPELAARYDFVLFEGHKRTPIPKIWLLAPDQEEPPADLENCLAVLQPGEDRLARMIAFVQQRIQESQTRTSVYGCVLIGGQSRRMGRPKHLLVRDDGQTWLDYTVAQLQQICCDVVIVGEGDLPASLRGRRCLPDPPDVDGPMAGILAALRWMPRADWLVSACDLPQLSVAALQWLLDQRAPAVWAVMPRLLDAPGLEPLLAYYSAPCIRLFEPLVTQGNFCPLPVAEHLRVLTPTVPAHLATAWHNVNAPEDYRVPG